MSREPTLFSRPPRPAAAAPAPYADRLEGRGLPRCLVEVGFDFRARATDDTRADPAVAECLLTRNIENYRALKKLKVEHYAHLITRGEWYDDASTPIALDWFGTLGNGQHRLHAIIRAGIEVPLRLEYGVDPEAFKYCDTGSNRTYSDTLMKCGEKQARAVAAAARLLWRYRADQLYNLWLQPTVGELDCILAAEPQLRDSLPFGKRMDFLRSHAAATVGHYLCATADPRTAERFFDVLITGERAEPGDPALVLRNQVVKGTFAGSSMKIVPADVLARVLIAFKAAQRGRKMAQIKWVSGIQEYPRI